MYMPKLRQNAAAGFSFLELIMYILIVGILAGSGALIYQRWVGRARITTTHTNLKLLKSNIDIYYTEKNKYPNSLNDLAKEKLIRKIPKDGWKKDFRYKVTPSAKEPYELYSFGKSGPQGTKEERISVWDI